MPDRNFEVELKTILEYLPLSNEKPDTEDAENEAILLANMKTKKKFRQTVLFSATMPPAVERIAKLYANQTGVAKAERGNVLGAVSSPARTGGPHGGGAYAQVHKQNRFHRHQPEIERASLSSAGTCAVLRR